MKSLTWCSGGDASTAERWYRRQMYDQSHKQRSCTLIVTYAGISMYSFFLLSFTLWDIRKVTHNINPLRCFMVIKKLPMSYLDNEAIIPISFLLGLKTNKHLKQSFPGKVLLNSDSSMSTILVHKHRGHVMVLYGLLIPNKILKQRKKREETRKYLKHPSHPPPQKKI